MVTENKSIGLNGSNIGLPEKMKRMGFVEDVGKFTRKFTQVKVIGESLYICHVAHNEAISIRPTEIRFEDLDFFIEAFDRI